MKEKSKSLLNAPPIITIYGNESVKIENIKGIQGFTTDGISVKTDSGIVFAAGESLTVQSYEDGIVTICGRICSVSYL